MALVVGLTGCDGEFSGHKLDGTTWEEVRAGVAGVTPEGKTVTGETRTRLVFNTGKVTIQEGTRTQDTQGKWSETVGQMTFDPDGPFNYTYNDSIGYIDRDGHIESFTLNEDEKDGKTLILDRSNGTSSDKGAIQTFKKK